MSKQQTKEFMDIFRQNNGIILLIDPASGDIVDANLAAAKFYGYDHKELITKNIYQINNLTKNKILEKVESAKKLKKWAFEFEHRLRDGQVRHVEIFTSLIKLDNKKFSFAVIYDITEKKRLKADEGEKEILYKGFFENNPTMILLIDKNTGDIVDGNPAACKFYGYTREELKSKNMVEINIISKERLLKKYTQVALGQRQSFFFKHRLSNGEVVYVQANLGKINIGGRELIYSMLYNVSNERHYKKALRESEARFRTLFNQANDMIFVHKMDEQGLPGKLLEVNDVSVDKLGYSREKLLSMSLVEFTSFEAWDPKKIKKVFEEIFRKGYSTFETRYVTKDGKELPVEVSTHIIEFSGEQVYIDTARDLTERQKAKKKLESLAYFDQITKLPNRYLIQKHIKNNIRGSKRTSEKIAVLTLVLEKFKFINDIYGHSFGDKLLKEAGKRLTKCVDSIGFVGRYEAGQFIVLVKAVEELIIPVCNRIAGSFAKPFVIAEHEVFSPVSLGIAKYPDDGLDAEALIKNAGMAMYSLDSFGKKNFQFYNREMNDVMNRRLELENGLRKALQNKELFLYYQPKFTIMNRKIIGVEALIRWYHPAFGLVSPVEFIPIAEETGLIVQIGNWVLEEACQQLKKWHELGMSSLTVSVNLSPIQMQARNFVGFLVKTLEKTKLNPELLELEITESIMQNIKDSTTLVKELKQIGVKVSIDDFGTGYSCLSLLQHLPIDFLKIDRSFINDICSDKKTEALVKNIINLGHDLNFKIIAEGIEDNKQISMLKNLKCDNGQGYIFSKPMSPSDLTKEFLQTQGTVPDVAFIG